MVTWGTSPEDVVSINGKVPNPDNEKSIEILMQRLYDFGHRKIGFLNVHQNFNYGYQRKNAYEEFHKNKNIKLNPKYYQESLDHATVTGISLSKKLLDLKDPPTAIICSLDKYFIGCLQECQRRGLVIAKDISIVGYNDHDNYLSSQNVTYISHPLAEMGKMAIKMLEQLDQGEKPENLSKLIKPILNKGKSDGRVS